jgi:acyl-[acyl-carrier-protein]-phospholipid O-acyltransferase/long-chain-fatty-acid--[acyl-carrier-protein] ligase
VVGATALGLTLLGAALAAVLGSVTGGCLAESWRRERVVAAAKLLESAVVLTAITGVFLDADGGVWRSAVVWILAGLVAAAGPARQVLACEALPYDRLSRATADLELAAFLGFSAAVLVPLLFADPPDASAASLAQTDRPLAVLAGLVSFLSLGAFRGLRGASSSTPAGRSASLGGAWSAIRADRVLRLTVLGQALLFAFAGASLRLMPHGAEVGPSAAGVWPAVFLGALGLGAVAGALLAGRLSAGKVETGLLPLGASGIALCTLAFGVVGVEGGPLASLGLIGALGAACGVTVVPLRALLARRAPAERRAAVLGIAQGAALAALWAGIEGTAALLGAGVESGQLLVGATVATLASTVWVLRLLPDAFLRFLLLLLTHSFYRLRVLGSENLPRHGGVLLVPNHVSFVDGLFVLASVDRPVRFLVESSYFHHPFFRPFLSAMGAIPVSAAGGPRQIIRALRSAGDCLDRGQVVCIFAEGQITRTGNLLPFRKGLERIVKGRDAVVLPVHLDRVWGSIFSRSHDRFFTKMPHRVPYPVTVSFGAPLPASAAADEVRRAVQELGAAAWMARQRERPPLHHTFVRAARRAPMRLAFAERSGTRLGRFGVLLRAVLLARRLRSRWRGQEYVGVLLPPGIGGTLVNLAAALAGRASVNLNYTAGRAGLASAARQAKLRSVVTHRAFLAKARVELPEGVEAVWIEDVAAEASWLDKACAFLAAALLPVRRLERFAGAERPVRGEDTVTVIFSSGSTGEPKGVLLTHANVDSNVEGVSQVLRLHCDDRLLGILPLFHSFGCLALWFAANQGLATVFYPNPLDAAAVGELVQSFQVTLVIATPTFLQLYLRRLSPSQFGSVRLVLAGAEKLQPRLAQAFEEHFGVKPLEGYGATECSPVVATSVPDFRAPGFFQPGSRRGSVGQPLPGVAVRVVDPATHAALPEGEEGLLLVKGPNVMKGYLGRDDLSGAALQDGWYVTGDIARLDEEGFLWITDRLARFSKIGGEMVPHGRIEEALHEAAGADGQVFAVTSVPDERKGERIAVLHTVESERIPDVVAKLAASGLPNLFIPRADDFVRVDTLPLLGTGKLDLRAVRKRALEALEMAR